MGVVVLVLVGSAIATAIIAAHKGLNPLGWFVVGLLLGPIGVVVALCSKPPAASAEVPPAPAKPGRLRKTYMPPAERAKQRLVYNPETGALETEAERPGYYE